MKKKIIIPHSKPWITRSDRDAVDATLASGMIGEGEAVSNFESAVAKRIGVRGGVAASTGTMALYYALKALGAGPGHEVIMPTFVCRAVMDAVTDSGAAPVFCDIGDDWCVNADTVSARITGKTRAVIVVHTYGISADIQPVCELSVPVIEDFCPAFGGGIGGRALGSFGAISVTSFYATKPLTTGEGGMALSDDDELLSTMRKLKNGTDSPAEGRRRCSMSDIQAALGLRQLVRYDKFLERRREIADFYFSRLDGLPVALPHNIRDRSIFFRFPIRPLNGYAPYPGLFEMESIDIARGGVDYPLHIKCGAPAGSLPNAEKLFAETLSIPIYPALLDVEIERVADACRRIFYRQGAAER
ncbi:MAG: DegT/DnrJ/EryC1/StrS aminotransferase family protein [bacterium]